MVKLIILILCAAIIGIILKSVKSPIHLFPGIIISILVLIYVSYQLEGIFNFIERIATKADIDVSYLNTILKCIGICFLGDFTSSICKDCGETTLAYNAELLSKCSIVVISLPLYSNLLDLIFELWENV